MSMLAEPRRRNKWSLNPRGNHWANDQNKMGQKLLEMMGWSKGRGLGREEQGDIEPVRLNYKCDTKGMGFKGHDDGWLAHKEDFNAILSELNGTDAASKEDEAITVKSLETRSKSSKARVHYQKFTRGKDLSRCSAEDLACILGTRPHKKEETEITEDVEEPVEEVEDKVEHSHGVVTIRKGNIQDYFATKMAAMKLKWGQGESSPQTDANLDEKYEKTEQLEGEDEMNAKKRVRFNEDLNVVNEFSAKMRILAEPKDKLKKLKKEKKKHVEEVSMVQDDKGVRVENTDSAINSEVETNKMKKSEDLVEVVQIDSLNVSKPVDKNDLKSKDKKKGIKEPKCKEAIATSVSDETVKQRKKKKKHGGEPIDRETKETLKFAVEPTEEHLADEVHAQKRSERKIKKGMIAPVTDGVPVHEVKGERQDLPKKSENYGEVHVAETDDGTGAAPSESKKRKRTDDVGVCEESDAPLDYSFDCEC